MALFPRRERRKALRRAAVDYAGRGWFVVPGTHIVHDGRSRGRHARSRQDARPLRCSCKLPLCPVPGEHPAAPDWQVQATCDPEAVAWWWSGRDVPNVVLATGWSFDALHVPSGLGTRVFGRLRDPHLPVPVGPVSRSVSGDWWFFVGPALDTDQPWLDRLASLGVRHLGPGGFLLAPPSTGGAAGGLGWVVPPPDPRDTLPTVQQLTGVAMGVSPRFGTGQQHELRHGEPDPGVDRRWGPDRDDP
ncbi:MAG TPA: bifunctional DNA primase/polymerase [Mycobacteriales bacterium]|nr:bifunctional DNA primase/polymerase [Mycobacteriales bacterium]